jgi:hypothetical protein
MSINARFAKRISSLALILMSLVVAAGWLTSCKAEECRRMTRCCEAIKDHEGVGGACGEMAQGVKAPDTCRVILSAARAMFEKRGEPVPAACQFKP